MECLRISNKEYRAREGISSTELKKIMKSPMHYRYWKDNPEETDTPSLLFGRAAHKYILETYDFYTEFTVAPNVDRRTKEGKEIEYARTRLIVAARAAGIDVYDTPFTDINDEKGVVEDTKTAKDIPQPLSTLNTRPRTKISSSSAGSTHI